MIWDYLTMDILALHTDIHPPVALGQQQKLSFCSIKPHNFPSYLLLHFVYWLIQRTFTNIKKPQ